MLFKGSFVTAASGKLGGIVASHNKGGKYLREFVIPTDPSTPAQNLIRNALANLSNRWENTLTEAQRDGWNDYGANVTVVNRLGDPINLSGINNYVRSNTPRSQIGTLPRVDDAPATYNVGDFTSPTAIFSEAAQTISVSFDTGDDWVSEDDAAMLVYVGRPQNAGVNFFKGPYRLAGSIDGDSAVPPTSPAAIPVPFAFVDGDAMFWYVRVTRADGRLSNRFRDRDLAVA